MYFVPNIGVTLILLWFNSLNLLKKWRSDNIIVYADSG